MQPASTTRPTLSPSDLSNFLACEHLTTLELRGTPRPGRDRSAGRADPAQGRGARARPTSTQLRADGRDVVEIDARRRLGRGRRRDRGGAPRRRRRRLPGRASATARWRGIADFLARQPDGTYEALDTKLARHARSRRYILQLCFYTEQLARIQGARPERIHVVLGSGERAIVPARGVRRLLPARARAARAVRRRPAGDRAVAERPLRRLRLQAGLRRALGRGRPPLPRRRHPPHADREAARRRDRDARRARPRRADAPPPRHLAGDLREAPPAGRAPALGARRTAATATSCSQPQAGAGFALLPEPSPGDLFFDFEGNPFWDDDGEPRVPLGDPRRRAPLHAAPRARPRRASGARSSSSSTSSTRASREHPDMHVYHYAQYEITALKRLMGRYGTREDEIDDLLRRERLRRPARASSATASAPRGPATG